MWTKPPGFTASKHLWDAASSVEFYRAWREKPQYWIENLGFKDFWMYGRAADLDDFTRLILTSYAAPSLPAPSGACWVSSSCVERHSLTVVLQARWGGCHGPFHGGRCGNSGLST